MTKRATITPLQVENILLLYNCRLVLNPASLYPSGVDVVQCCKCHRVVGFFAFDLPTAYYIARFEKHVNNHSQPGQAGIL